MLKIAITGPESSGKTTLAKALSKHFDCPWVPEYAREYLSEKDGNYSQEDLNSILKGQLKLEEKCTAKNASFLFCDTDPLVLWIWSNAKFLTISSEINKAWLNHNYDLYLLLYPDLEWEFDPLRENKNDRMELFALYHEMLKTSGRSYVVIRGKDKLSKAIQAIESI